MSILIQSSRQLGGSRAREGFPEEGDLLGDIWGSVSLSSPGEGREDKEQSIGHWTNNRDQNG